jgi:gamma-glutamyltranspeptidase/glutathione hydrolase
MGGDLFAIVHRDGQLAPDVLNASGRAGSGVDPVALRAEGHVAMPFRHDVRTITVPGCVDGWLALHDRHGTLPLERSLAPAIRLAEEGFPASPLLTAVLVALDAPGRAQLHELVGQATHPGALVRRPGVAGALRAISGKGRDGFYGGEFGAGLKELGAGVFTDDDLARPQADWVEPLAADAWGRRIWTVPPNSQGYLALTSAWIASGLSLPDDPDDPAWAHLLIEASLEAGFDRPNVLHEGADPTALVNLQRLQPRADNIDPAMTKRRPLPPLSDGDTTYLCTVDGDRMAVSLIQSNASGLGSWLAEPATGINLHNRGLGFSLEEGHPAELAPGARPPHTLSPLMLTHPDGRLVGPLGTMGGDGQPQILLQLLARLLRHEQSPGAAIGAGRWLLHGPTTGFDTWTAPEGPSVIVEGHASERWADGLRSRGHTVNDVGAHDSAFGHAHVIVRDSDDLLTGAADQRTRVGSAAGR